MIIQKCDDCPFFSTNLLALFRNTHSGFCGYDSATDAQVPAHTQFGPGTPEHEVALRAWNARLPVPDRRTLPDACPLRTRDIRLTLGD